MKLTLALLILASSLVACKPEELTIRDACVYLEEYIVIAKTTDHLDTKKASKKQIDHYKRFCK
jgi:hypothetical protein